MSNDELYYDDLTDLAARVAQGIQNRTQPLDALTQTLNQLIGTDTIKGLGADSMKAYVSEVHLPLIQTFQLALNNYQMALGKYVKGYLDVDSDAGFKLIREDLEDHQTKLTTHRSDYTDLAEQLKSLSDEASSIVSLGGAGSSYLNKVADKMDDMKKTAKDLLESWDNYEQTDPGFAQVQELLARTRGLIKSALNVPGGYSYSPGSFSGLMSAEFLAAYQANLSYATDVNNQNEFSKNWESIMNEYGADQQRLEEAAAKKKAQEEGLFGLLWDGLQIAAGAVMVATGVGAPLGVVLIAGGVNSAINHASMAITGKGFNLVGMASENIGKWYNSSLGKALGQDGAGGIVNGIFQGAGEMVSGMAQMSVYDIGKGVNTLFTNGEARQQMFDGIGSWWNQLCTGDSVAIGKTVFNVASIFVGGAEVKGAAQIAKASSAEGLLAKSGVFIKALGQTTVKNAVETGKMFKNLPGNLKNGAERFSTKVYDSRFAASMREVLGKGNPRLAFDTVGNGRPVLTQANRSAYDIKKVNELPSGAKADFNSNVDGVRTGVNPDEFSPQQTKKIVKRELTPDQKKTYARPSGFRKDVRDQVWSNAEEAGPVLDPLTKMPIDPDEPWDMGHKPGYEFWKHQQSAAERGISRKQFLDEYNNPEHYRPELPSSNRGHAAEDATNTYFGD
ncbi:hypothetical protein OfM1_05560 [Lactovum odontotermitis]